jgi:hypothetical protein
VGLEMMTFVGPSNHAGVDAFLFEHDLPAKTALKARGVGHSPRPNLAYPLVENCRATCDDEESSETLYG